MKRIITVFGLIAGAIVSFLMIISVPFMKEGQHDYNSMIIGFAGMLLAFCFIFIAIKNYRDKHLGGVITFGKAITIGLWIALIASVCYTITWVIIYKNFYPEAMDQWLNMELARLQRSGKSPKVIAEATRKLEESKAFYNTWPGLIGYTLVEILPLGIVVALVSSLILMRRTKKPAGMPQTA